MLVVVDVVVEVEVEVEVVVEELVVEDEVVEVVVVVVVVWTAARVAATDQPRSAKVASADAGPTIVKISPFTKEEPEPLAAVATVPAAANVKVPNSAPFFFTEKIASAVAAVPAII